MMTRGKFITFEGGEGCGKSTQVRSARPLNGMVCKLYGAWVEIETNTAAGDRNAILPSDPPCDRAELLLFLAARAQLARNVIRPALEAGTWVISDRFSDSTLAYQGYGRGLPLDIIREANDFACEGLKPDRTILLDVDSATARERMRGREASTNTTADRIERAGDDFHSRLRKGFLEMAAAEPSRIVTVDASGGEDEVWERVWKSLTPML